MTANRRFALTDIPKYFPDCCAGLSNPLIETLLIHLPRNPELILSIGCGSGLLENLLLCSSAEENGHGILNLCGVEVALCENKHLPEHRYLYVTGSKELHPEALLASSLMFVYPRTPSLVARYLESCRHGVMNQVIWLSHKSDWSEFEAILQQHFITVEHFDGSGIAEHELLVIATSLRQAGGPES